MTDQNGVSPLMLAARSGSAGLVQELLSHGAAANVRENAAGQTALMWAVARGHVDAVRVLIEHGAEVNAHSQARSLLVTIGGGGNETQPGCFSRKAGGGESGNVSVLRCDSRGPARTIQVGGTTPLQFAARLGCVQCAKLLLDAGAKIDEPAADGNSALVLAAHSGQGAFAAFLLDRAANPNFAGAGYTALHAAVLRGDLDLLKALLAHGASVDARLKNGTEWRHNAPDYSLPESLVGATAFLLAANFASVEMMRALATGGADLQLSARDGTTPLMAAAEGEAPVRVSRSDLWKWRAEPGR